MSKKGGETVLSQLIDSRTCVNKKKLIYEILTRPNNN